MRGVANLALATRALAKCGRNLPADLRYDVVHDESVVDPVRRRASRAVEASSGDARYHAVRAGSTSGGRGTA